MGAWIETLLLMIIIIYQFVAPYVGAWIETCEQSTSNLRAVKSHPTWVRGLKLGKMKIGLIKRLVAPYVGAWIETKINLIFLALT